jgi:hypothetical protein
MDLNEIIHTFFCSRDISSKNKKKSMTLTINSLPDVYSFFFDEKGTLEASQLGDFIAEAKIISFD